MKNAFICRIRRACIVSIIFIGSTFTAQAKEFSELSKPNDIRHISVNEDITLDVYIPPKVSEQKLLPVLYVMDSQYYMYNAIGYQKALQFGVKISPDYIVVGINTELAEGKRRNFLDMDAEIMTALITDKIVPYIDKHYPNSGRRLYFGWQYGAIFGMKLFNRHPDLFEGFFLASGQRYSESQLQKLEQHLKSSHVLNNAFYLSLGKMEQHTVDGHEKIAALFEKYSDKNIRWKYSYFDRFSTKYDHHTTPLESLTNGLEWYFSDYPDLSFKSLEDLEKFGGIKAVKAYFQYRAKRYLMSAEIGEQAKFSIFRHAAQANNYPLFKRFEQEIGTYEVTGWHHFFAKFYFENNAFDRAEQTYRQGLKESPTDPRTWAGLGALYEKQKKLSEAANCYQQVLNNLDKTHARFTHYQQKLAKLNDNRQGS